MTGHIDLPVRIIIRIAIVMTVGVPKMRPVIVPVDMTVPVPPEMVGFTKSVMPMQVPVITEPAVAYAYSEESTGMRTGLSAKMDADTGYCDARPKKQHG